MMVAANQGAVHVTGSPPEPKFAKFSRPLPTCGQRDIQPMYRSSSTSQQVQRSQDQGAYYALPPCTTWLVQLDVVMRVIELLASSDSESSSPAESDKP